MPSEMIYPTVRFLAYVYMWTTLAMAVCLKARADVQVDSLQTNGLVLRLSPPSTEDMITCPVAPFSNSVLGRLPSEEWSGVVVDAVEVEDTTR